ncbi:putative acetyltransferase [Candidatus Rubidus massiliensis]|nr:putative acetyltransferase [Candidatus Rubidus massiliensis]
MQITIDLVNTNKKEIIQNLARFYVYEMSRFCGFLPGWKTPSDGLYTCFDLSRYWTEPHRFPYLIHVDEELAGFALIHKIGSLPTIDWTIGEFFVIAKYQNKGVGKFVAHNIFDQFKGMWEVCQIPENKPAIIFWEKIIKEYSSDNYTKNSIIVQEPSPHPMIALQFMS